MGFYEFIDVISLLMNDSKYADVIYKVLLHIFSYLVLGNVFMEHVHIVCHLLELVFFCEP